jgi:hypothetical protein
MRRHRGRHALPAILSAAQRKTLAEMATDAIDLLLSGIGMPCPDCDRAIDAGDRFPMCERHQADFAQVEEYRRLARLLGAELP